MGIARVRNTGDLNASSRLKLVVFALLAERVPHARRLCVTRRLPS